MSHRALGPQFNVTVGELYPHWGGSRDPDPQTRWNTNVDLFRQQHERMPATREWEIMRQKEDIPALARDIESNGQRDPIEVSAREEGGWNIEDGHHRAAAVAFMRGPEGVLRAQEGHRRI